MWKADDLRSDRCWTEQIPAVAFAVEEDGNPPIGLVPWFGDELDVVGQHSLPGRFEIVDAEEQPDPTGELRSDRRCLSVPVGSGQEQTRLGARRPNDHPSFGPTIVRRGRRVLYQLEAEHVDEDADRPVVVPHDESNAFEIHESNLASVGKDDLSAEARRNPNPSATGHTLLQTAAVLVMVDLDNTLGDRQRAVEAWTAEFVVRHGWDTDRIEWLLSLDNDGYSSRAEVFQTIATEDRPSRAA